MAGYSLQSETSVSDSLPSIAYLQTTNYPNIRQSATNNLNSDLILTTSPLDTGCSSAPKTQPSGGATYFSLIIRKRIIYALAPGIIQQLEKVDGHWAYLLRPHPLQGQLGFVHFRQALPPPF
ncbi:hypothetical protein ACFE04_019665 [Oxalis oulophora]